MNKEKPKTWEACGGGINRRLSDGRFAHRVKIDGVWTSRMLQAATLTAARLEAATNTDNRVKAMAGLNVENKYAGQAEKKETVSVGTLIEDYLAKGCPKPTKSYSPRTGDQLGKAESLLNSLRPFWVEKIATKVVESDCHQYAEFRRSHEEHGVKNGTDGGCVIDMEMGLLSVVFNWSVSTGRLSFNPFLRLAKVPKFRKEAIKHCKDYMPDSGAEFHAVAGQFLAGDPESEVLGFQYLFEGMTALRTCEALQCRWDAPSKAFPGFVGLDHGNRFLSVPRAKSGINPYIQIHPGLEQLLDAMRQWRSWRGIDSPWFFPSPEDPSKHVATCSLGQALRRDYKRRVKLNPQAKKYTSHGARAFCVTVWRGQGIQDNVVGFMIGHNCGAELVVKTYGRNPEGWRGGPELDFMCPEPAWLALQMPANVVSMEVA